MIGQGSTLEGSKSVSESNSLCDVGHRFGIQPTCFLTSANEDLSNVAGSILQVKIVMKQWISGLPVFSQSQTMLIHVAYFSQSSLLRRGSAVEKSREERKEKKKGPSDGAIPQFTVNNRT